MNDLSLAPLDQSQQLAHFCKASSDSLRLMILRVLASDSFGVQELCTIFSIKQSAMSHHLKVLAQAGLVERRREGNSIFYRRSEPASRAQLQRLQRQLFVEVDALSINAEVSQGIERVRCERSQRSQLFFNQNINNFREQQDLIADYQQYSDSVRQMLSSLPLSAHGCVVEVGPGAGEFLSELSPRFEQVIALDNSKVMLEQARDFADSNKLSNITFIHGDTSDARQQQLRADCVVMNMVLHHTPSPADIFRDVASIMQPGASLLITELCHHDQEWARDACGDLWLGFEPSDLDTWATAVGLHDGQNVYLALRNGFRIQVRQFYKPTDATGTRCPLNANE
ncbi:ArsR family transcriptional regulator [Sinobacterium caligoides]|uniref:ArsR family transcriptional regulator n=1 Tax=Sinobacterium caligoides TaxID=933926 RepID=A0A3N2DGP3_9GAMM|nr:metalloregulator ArsR/SmtB family transcription factor [Sinobacterium caligoides]ROR98911.1 ArsR family transcriptional regulator [Sinobacterium caligoides]